MSLRSKRQKVARRLRREANKLLAKRRYRERKSGVLAPVWSVRRGPTPPPRKQGMWSGRHGEGGEISMNGRKRRAAAEAKKQAEKARRGVKA